MLLDNVEADRDTDVGRVLVADNDALITSVLRSLLTKAGQQVDWASTTEEAMALADQHVYRLMTLDLDMPSAGGLHVCRELRRRPEYQDTTIAVLTAFDYAQTRDRCLEAGATLFVPKPFNPAALMRQLLPYVSVPAPSTAGLNHVLSADRGLQLQDVAARRR